jgi:adenine-specific DNA-methyltransferase
MAKKYTGSLSLDWYNKQKSIMSAGKEDLIGEGNIPAPKINWVNKDEALFFEINEDQGKGGKEQFWVNKSDIRIKEARPLILQKTFKAAFKNKSETIPEKKEVLEVRKVKKMIQKLIICSLKAITF